MSKKLPTDTIARELSHSVFFQKPPDEQVHSPPPAGQTQREAHSPPSAAHVDQGDESAQQDGNPVGNDASKTNVMLDVLTSLFAKVNLKQWQEIIEDTETQNSALRLTSEERYAIEDVVNELRRQYGIKTSMNEIARLGLLLLIQDFKQYKKNSIIHKVKKA